MWIADVSSSQALERYLISLNEAQRVPLSQAVALRMALRVAPMAGLFWLKRDTPASSISSMLPVFGALAVAEGRLKRRSKVSGITVRSAANACSSLAYQFGVGTKWWGAAHAAHAAAWSAYAHDPPHQTAAQALDFALAAGDDDSNPIQISELQADLDRANSGVPAADLGPLWQNSEGRHGLDNTWAVVREMLNKNTDEHWGFWTAWYDRISDGWDTKPKEIAHILENISKSMWLGDPAPVNKRLRHVFSMYVEEATLDVREVRSRKSLETYLYGLDAAQAVAAARRVSFRTAARFLPLTAARLQASSHASERGYTLLPLFGALATASLGTASPPIEPRKAASAARAAEIIGATAASTAAQTSFGQIQVLYAGLTVEAALPVAADAGMSETFWEEIRADLSGDPGDALDPIWAPQSAGVPSVMAAWSKVRKKLLDDAGNWEFWVTWYERVLAGAYLQDEKMAAAMDPLRSDDWMGDPKDVNTHFDHILALFELEDTLFDDAEAEPDPDSDLEPTQLAAATPVEFGFDALARVMRLIGVDDDLAHLKEPRIVEKFLDDSEEVQDALQDFADYAQDLGGGGNFASVLKRASEKVLREFTRTKDRTHLRARMIVTYAGDLERFSRDEKARSDLGDTLSGMLDDRVDMLKGLCRKHFGPSYLALAPLAQLSLEQVDQAEALALFDAALSRLAGLNDPDLIALDAESLAVLDDMRRELHDTRAAIAEATSDDFRALLHARFAQSSGALGLSLGRFYETSSTAAGTASRHADAIIKGYKRVSSLRDILDVVMQAFGGAP